jgi:GT2 family glycosyltransferase
MPNFAHLIICTHTPRYLDAVLRAVSSQQERPHTVSVSVDGDDPRILEICRTRAGADRQPILVTLRPSHGVMRAAQVRNNAVRTLCAAGHRDGLLLFIDGDIVLARDAIARHDAVFAPGSITIGDRINLSAEQTARILDTGTLPADAEIAADLERLTHLRSRTQMHQWLRDAGLTKAHKPRAISAHLAVDFDLFDAVNGFDEGYEGYGCEDDDLVRRIYAAGGRSTIAIGEIRAYHLFHRTQAGRRWRDNPGTRRFLRPHWPVASHEGLRTPAAQNAVRRLVA